MAFGKDWDDKKENAFGKNWDAEKMFQLYIYIHMKKKNLHDVAEIFAKEANLEMFELVESGDGLLAEWWELFWPTFCSRMSNEAVGANAESSGKPSVQTSLGVLAGLNQGAGSSQQAQTGRAQQNVLPVIVTNLINKLLAGDVASSLDFTNMEGMQPANLLPTPGTSQRRADKRPIYPEYDNVLGQSTARNVLVLQASANQQSVFRHVSLPGQAPSTMASAGNPSYVRLPASPRSTVQVTRDLPHDVAIGSGDQMDSTRLAGLDSTSPAAAHLDAGLSEFLKKYFQIKHDM